MKRREFITKGISAGVVAGASYPLLANENNILSGGNKYPESHSVEGKTNMSSTKGMKMGLYSITYLGCWYKDRPLTWQEVLQRAKDFGYDGVEFDAKRPHANPMDWDQNTRKAVRDRAGELGIELPALAANNDFTSPTPEHREAELLMVREQIKLAADLGCKILRLFAAWPGITLRDGWATYDEARKEFDLSWIGVPRLIRVGYLKECLKEVSKIAEDYGVILVLQNHAPITRNWRDVYDIVTTINSPNLKICFDVAYNEDDKGNITEAINTIGKLDVHYHFNGDFKRLPDGKVILIPTPNGDLIKNYPHMINELARVGYEGYLCWEFCHNVYDHNGNPGTLKDVDEQTKLALEYMRGLIADAKKQYG